MNYLLYYIKSQIYKQVSMCIYIYMYNNDIILYTEIITCLKLYL